MLSLILSLSLIDVRPAAVAGPVQPCVWPNLCRSAEVAQVQPCVWPNRCVQPPAQFEVCVWPRRCA